MKIFKILFLFLFIISRDVYSYWGRILNVSDREYKLYVISDDKLNITEGYYLTTFPCDGENSREYYKTVVGQNLITLYCFETPKIVYLSYVTKPAGTFVPKNEKTNTYMKCNIEVVTDGNNGTVPLLQVNVAKCEKNSLNSKSNYNIKKSVDVE